MMHLSFGPLAFLADAGDSGSVITLRLVDLAIIAIGAIGTGLILLGVNAIRSWKGIPIKNDNNVLGAIAIVWGVLDQARHMLGLSPWLSLALLLFVVGFAYLLAPVLARPSLHTRDDPGDV